MRRGEDGIRVEGRGIFIDFLVGVQVPWWFPFLVSSMAIGFFPSGWELTSKGRI